MSSTAPPQQPPLPPPPPPRVEITVAQSVSEVPAAEWDALVGAQPEYNPCVSHAFLHALEASGSAAPSRGWLPHHLIAREVNSGRLVGAAPLYLKGHSRGEYVFDQGWADASHRMGVPYYPKAVGAVPMTPVSGPRLLAVNIPSSSSSSLSSSSPAPAAAATADSVRLALADALVELSTSEETAGGGGRGGGKGGGGGVSGAHVLFCSEDDAAALAATGAFKQRLGLQYHWFNNNNNNNSSRSGATTASSSSSSSAPSPPSTSQEEIEGGGEEASSSPLLYSSFEDFLSALKQSKRKLVRQERKRALSSSSSAAPFLQVSRVRGTDLRADELRAFYGYYVDTCERRWGQDYLTESFFMRLGENPDVLLVLASEPATTEVEARRNRVAAEDGLRARRVVEVAASSSSSSSPPSSPSPSPEAISPPFTPFGPRGRALAGALNLVGSHALFGRNWGCDPRVRDVPFLHFELSYYQAIEAAIEARLPRVEAGAQGEHKIARGYVPTFTRSFHCLRERGLDAAVAQFLRSEAREVEYVLEVMTSAKMSPYKR